MVDGRAGSLVVPRLLGVLEVTNVPDKGGGAAVGARAATVKLVVLVVHDKPLLVLRVEDPALVSVGSTLISGDGDELGVLLVGDVVDGLSMLVVSHLYPPRLVLAWFSPPWEKVTPR